MSYRLELISAQGQVASKGNLTGISAFVVSCLTLAACLVGTAAHALPEWAKTLRGEGSKYLITNSGYEGYSFGPSAVAWIDDYRVVFLSYGTLLSSGQPRRSGLKGLYLWDTRSGNVEKYAEPVSGFCYADGMLHYWGEQDGAIVEHVGKVGNERKRVYAKRDFPLSRDWHLNPLTCQYYRDEQLPTREGVLFRPLRTGDGYLGGGTAAGSNFTIFLRQDGGEYRRLPVPTRTATAGYSELAGAYVLRETPPILLLNAAVDMRFWLFTVETVHVKPLVIPAGPWLRGDISFVRPTPRGVVFTSHAAGKADRDGRPTTGPGGVYLLANKKAKRVMAGYPYSASITSDGCKVAVSMASRGMADEPAAVKFVDLCPEER